MTDRARLERAAIAAFLAFQHDVAPSGRISWESAPAEMRETVRMVADAVLMIDPLSATDPGSSDG